MFWVYVSNRKNDYNKEVKMSFKFFSNKPQYTFSSDVTKNSQTCEKCKSMSFETEYVKCQEPISKTMFWVCTKAIFPGSYCGHTNAFK